ncbi:nuclear transport factor 2 family protein [Nonomuraea basaltis]|uniref:nuclear transport factor 2 family protein n=1 Tax=Nonomuraea basaltis TaxID=2495887 RepID=UPI00110C4AE5|nr:nuclear transport factor 2 family protein [Nonomuraea basaltis]TMR98942.1 DUF4440 domain-containing protein [Nonomuraea basaltis]
MTKEPYVMETEAKILSPTTRINRRTVAEIYSALAAGNLQAFAERLAPDVKWTGYGDLMPTSEIAAVAGAATYYGPRDVIEKALGPIAAEWADFELTPFELTPVDDKVFVVGEHRGVHRVTGKAGVARFVHVWHLRDGKAQRLETVSDTHTLWKATQ